MHVLAKLEYLLERSNKTHEEFVEKIDIFSNNYMVFVCESSGKNLEDLQTHISLRPASDAKSYYVTIVVTERIDPYV